MVRKSKKLLVKTEIYQTEEANVKCTKLPEFIRAKKYLGAPFCVYFEDQVHLEGVKVTIQAGNYKNPNAELKNNESVIKNGVAEFQDLRFLGKSGRGTKFNVFIKLDTFPERIITYHNAIKVTVDGPRPPRTILKPKTQECKKSDEELLGVKRKSENQFLDSANRLDLEKYFASQPIKKRFRYNSFLTLSEPSISSNISKSPGACSSFTSSPALSPTSSSSLDILAEAASYDSHLNPKQPCTLCNCCTSFECLSLNSTTPDEDVYKNLVNNYLNMFMDMYKIRINKDLSNYLVDLVLNKAKSFSKIFNTSKESSSSSSANDEQFMFTFQLFYANLMQNFGKANLKNSCLSVTQSNSDL